RGIDTGTVITHDQTQVSPARQFFLPSADYDSIGGRAVLDRVYDEVVQRFEEQIERAWKEGKVRGDVEGDRNTPTIHLHTNGAQHGFDQGRHINFLHRRYFGRLRCTLGGGVG